MKPPTVIAQDYHRNGVGGVGFVVSLVKWPEALRGDFVAVSFYGGEPPEDEDTPDVRGDTFAMHTAVLNVPLLAMGVIDMYAKPQGNAWRGADKIGPLVAKAWRDRCRAEGYDPFDPDWNPEETEA